MTRGQEGLLMDLDEPGAVGPAAHRSVVGGFDPSVLVVQPASPDELVAHAAYLTDLDSCGRRGVAAV